MERLLELETAPDDVIQYAVANALAELTLYERLHLGPHLVEAVAVRCECGYGYGGSSESLAILTEALDADDVRTLVEIVRPHLP